MASEAEIAAKMQKVIKNARIAIEQQLSRRIQRDKAQELARGFEQVLLVIVNAVQNANRPWGYKGPGEAPGERIHAADERPIV